MANFNSALQKLLIEEGGSKYTETKGDNGGATKYGISQKAFPDLDIKNLTEGKAAEIYKREYWDKIKGDLILSERVAYCIFDCAVNMGVSTAVKFAQEIANCKIDGVVGSMTLAYLNSKEPEKFLPKFLEMRLEKYKLYVKRDPAQSKFINGWTARAKRACS